MVCHDFILPEDCKPCLFLSAFHFAKPIVPYLDIGQALRQFLFALLGLGIVYNDFDGGRFPHRVTSWYVCLLQFIAECLSDMTARRHLVPWSGGNGPPLRPGGGCLLGRQNDDPGCAPDRCSSGIS